MQFIFDRGYFGAVVDIDMFATTLVELDKDGQRTGKVAEFPNGLLLTHPVAPTD